MADDRASTRALATTFAVTVRPARLRPLPPPSARALPYWGRPVTPPRYPSRSWRPHGRDVTLRALRARATGPPSVTTRQLVSVKAFKRCQTDQLL